MNKIIRNLTLALLALFGLAAHATVPATKVPAYITAPVQVSSYYREEGTNGRDLCFSLWPRRYSPSAASKWGVELKYWPTPGGKCTIAGAWVPSLKFFWVIDPNGYIKLRHESSPYWSVPIPLNPYGFNPQSAYALEITSPGTTVFVNGLGTFGQGVGGILLPTMGYSFGWVTFSGITSSTAVWWRPVVPYNVVYPIPEPQ